MTVTTGAFADIVERLLDERYCSPGCAKLRKDAAFKIRDLRFALESAKGENARLIAALDRIGKTAVAAKED